MNKYRILLNDYMYKDKKSTIAFSCDLYNNKITVLLTKYHRLCGRMINIKNEDIYGIIEFKIVNQNDRDFLLDDINGMLSFSNISNDSIDIVRITNISSLYMTEEDFDKFMKKVLYYSTVIYLYFMESNIDNYRDPIFIFRTGFSKDPEKMKVDEYNREYDYIIKRYENLGFISINEYCGFEQSIPFVYLNTISSLPLIKLFKFIINDLKKKNNPLEDDICQEVKKCE